MLDHVCITYALSFHLILINHKLCVALSRLENANIFYTRLRLLRLRFTDSEHRLITYTHETRCLCEFVQRKKTHKKKQRTQQTGARTFSRSPPTGQPGIRSADVVYVYREHTHTRTQKNLYRICERRVCPLSRSLRCMRMHLSDTKFARATKPTTTEHAGARASSRRICAHIRCYGAHIFSPQNSCSVFDSRMRWATPTHNVSIVVCCCRGCCIVVVIVDVVVVVVWFGRISIVAPSSFWSFFGIFCVLLSGWRTDLCKFAG